jgi:Ca2+-binding RTX toxin-like protein
VAPCPLLPLQQADDEVLLPSRGCLGVRLRLCHLSLLGAAQLARPPPRPRERLEASGVGGRNRAARTKSRPGDAHSNAPNAPEVQSLIVGSTHTDWLYGNSQPNVFDGGGSPDFIYGRDGNDTILGSGGFDFLYGEGGNDLLDGQWQTDTSYGGDGDDQIWGGSNFLRREYPGTNYADVLYGDSGNDQLHGDARLPGGGLRTEYLDSLDLSAGRDELHGGPGHDLLNGDGADDTLWGDSGGDVFQFDATYVVLDMEGGIYAITPGNDVVKDFNFAEGDRLDFNQGIQFADSPVGMVITLLGPDNAVQGSVLLEGVHTFDSAWIV